MEAYLQEMGFEREQISGEVTYFFRHQLNPALVVKIFTSIAEQGTAVRAKDADAIRIVALLTWTRKGETELRRKALYKARVLRVNSVEGVLSRMRDKAREAYQALNEFRKENR